MVTIDMTTDSASYGNYHSVDGSKLITQNEAMKFIYTNSSGGSTTQLCTRGYLKTASGVNYWNGTDLNGDSQLIPARSLYRNFQFKLDRNENYWGVANTGYGTIPHMTITKVELLFYNNGALYKYYETTSGNSGWSDNFKLWGGFLNNSYLYFTLTVKISYIRISSSHLTAFPVWVKGINVECAYPKIFTPGVNFSSPISNADFAWDLSSSAITQSTSWRIHINKGTYSTFQSQLCIMM